MLLLAAECTETKHFDFEYILYITKVGTENMIHNVVNTEQEQHTFNVHNIPWVANSDHFMLDNFSSDTATSPRDDGFAASRRAQHMRFRWSWED